MIIAGGRSYVPKDQHIQAIEKIIELEKPSEIVTGDALGADKLGNDIAEVLGIKLVRMPYMSAYGAHGGSVRNVRMAEYVGSEGCLIALPGKRGTAHMVETAVRYGLKVYDLRGCNGKS